MKELEVIYEEIHPKIYAFFYVKTTNRAIAEELTQDVFYAACKGFKSFAGKSTLETWLFSIAQNILKKYYRSKRYSRSLHDKLVVEVPPPGKTPEDVYVTKESTNDFIRKLQVFDDLTKDIVMLRIFGELSFKEIAQLVGESENFVRVKFHRTKVKLQGEMEGKQ